MNISIHSSALQQDTAPLFSVSASNRAPSDTEAGKQSFSLAHKATDPIAQRKAQAFEKARDIVSRACEGEKKIDAQKEITILYYIIKGD